MDFDGNGNTAVDLPYIAINVKELIVELSALIPPPSTIIVRGYPHRVSRMAQNVPSKVIMAFTLIEKGLPRGSSTRVEVDIRDHAAWGG